MTLAGAAARSVTICCPAVSTHASGHATLEYVARALPKSTQHATAGELRRKCHVPSKMRRRSAMDGPVSSTADNPVTDSMIVVSIDAKSVAIHRKKSNLTALAHRI